jgi:hypothetical protein
MIRNPHFVKLIDTQPQDLSRWQVQAGRAKLMYYEIEVRAVPDYPVKRFGDKRAINAIQAGVLECLMKNFVRELPASFPPLQRLQTTETRIFASHTASPGPAPIVLWSHRKKLRDSPPRSHKSAEILIKFSR